MGYNRSHQKRFCIKLEVASIEESFIYKNEANKSNYTTYTLKTDFIVGFKTFFPVINVAQFKYTYEEDVYIPS